MKICQLLLCLAFVGGSLAAQVVEIDGGGPASGASNAFPWNRPAGFTTLHVYTAAQLTAAGIPPGAALIEVQVAPSQSGSGIYSAPAARMSVGHLLNSPPIAGQWESNLLAPTTVHDVSFGPYTFPWTQDTWTTLPSFDAAGFLWDGSTDIAIFYTSSPGVTGGFNIHRSTNLRHAVTVYQATTEAPTSNGPFAMKVRMTFCSGGGLYQTNQPEAEMSVDGMVSSLCFGAIANRSVNMVSNITFASSTPGFGYEIALAAPGGLVALGSGASTLPTTGQILNLDITAPGFLLLNNFTFPAFPGNFTIPFSSANPVRIAGQLGIVNPTNPDGFTFSGGIEVNVQ